MGFESPMVVFVSETFVSREWVPCACEREGMVVKNIKILVRLRLVHVLVGAVTLMNC